jgi:tetrahydromethanopterin S-methyltransferase subunit H
VRKGRAFALKALPLAGVKVGGAHGDSPHVVFGRLSMRKRVNMSTVDA